MESPLEMRAFHRGMVYDETLASAEERRERELELGSVSVTTNYDIFAYIIIGGSSY